MVFPLGSLVNAGVVVSGALIGMALGDKLPERMRQSVFQGLGLCTLAIGMGMTLKTGNPLYVVSSILIGILIGESLDLENKLLRAGERLKQSFHSNNNQFTEGFVSASLLFCIGSMAIIGPLNEGLTGDLTVIFTKSMLDFFAAMAFGAVYGSGVLMAALPVFIYQGIITLFAESLRPYITEQIQFELEAVGGVTIMGIGFNLIGLTKIRLSNFLPALLVIVVLCFIINNITSLHIW